MKTLLLCLLIVSMTPFAPCQQTSPPVPLNEAEKRQILGQLYELKSAREQIAAFEQYVQRDAEQDERERENWQRALELERQATDLARREGVLCQEKAVLFEQMYNALSKKKRRGLGCILKKVFTLGIARCQ